jgi:hypothetical protein
MNVKWNTLFYFLCLLVNVFHIYHICDQYFRYDVSTNVRIGLPDIVEFPSTTLCLNLVESLKWEEMPSELTRKLLFQLPFPRFQNQTFIEEFIKNPSLIGPEVRSYGLKNPKILDHIYNRLARQINASEILNLTASFEQVFRFFGSTGLAHNSYRSPKLKQMEYRLTTASDFQFSADMIFIHSKRKCFSMSFRLGQKMIRYKDLVRLLPIFGSNYYERFKMMSWFSSFGSIIHAYVHDKGYWITDVMDAVLRIKIWSDDTLDYQPHESVLLKFPYKTNCRDYTQSGFQSRRHCVKLCVRWKTLDRFKSIIETSYAFSTDNIPLQEIASQADKYAILRPFDEDCEDECPETDCRYVTYTRTIASYSNQTKLLQQKCTFATGSKENCSLYNSNAKPLEHSSLSYIIGPEIVTRTESQVAYPLISFLTEVLATFGIWLGLSVSGSVVFMRQTWTKARKLKNESHARQRLNPNERPILEQLNLSRQPVIILPQRIICKSS